MDEQSEHGGDVFAERRAKLAAWRDSGVVYPTKYQPRDEIGPVAALKEVVIVPALPKTRSGKILRATMRSIADGREVVVPSTIEDVRVLEAITPLLSRDGADS